ncbi:MAG: sulfite exporter TauE/SafE family protein, partial [Rhodocyclaceae bacterium]
MNDTLFMAAGLAVLSVASGMLGLGVAFAAVPFLGLFLHDLVHEVQPLSLVLNGITALFSLFGFAKSGLVDWRPAILLAIVTIVAAPLGAWFAQHVDARWLWAFYFVAVAFLAWRMFQPDKPAAANAEAHPNLGLALILAVPISVAAGMLGVGPGFLLLPTLILLKYEPKHAAAINALAVTPPSFSALIPHLATARIDLTLAAILVVVG